jgi:predicted GIY-YIG superfamily endonuclease
MSCFVYIIYSKTLAHYYTGISKHGSRRVREHRLGRNSSTRAANDWTLIWTLAVTSYKEARAIERQIKKQGAKRYLERCKNDCRGPASAG